MRGRHPWRTISYRSFGSWAISNPEIPGFAPPPHDELAFLDTLGIGISARALEGPPRNWRFRTGSEAEPVPAPPFDLGLAERTTTAVTTSAIIAISRAGALRTGVAKSGAGVRVGPGPVSAIGSRTRSPDRRPPRRPSSTSKTGGRAGNSRLRGTRRRIDRRAEPLPRKRLRAVPRLPQSVIQGRAPTRARGLSGFAVGAPKSSATPRSMPRQRTPISGAVSRSPVTPKLIPPS